MDSNEVIIRKVYEQFDVRVSEKRGIDNVNEKPFRGTVSYFPRSPD